MKHRKSLMLVNYQKQSLGNNSLMLLGNRPTMIDIKAAEEQCGFKNIR